MEKEKELSKKEKVLHIAKEKAFGYKGVKGKNKTKKRVLNAMEKRALRMEGSVGQLMHLYEELRRRDCPNKEELIDQVFELQKEKLAKTGCIPRFARVYQSCAKHGTAAQLQVLLDAYKGQIATMAISPYGNQLVVALLNYSRPEQQPPLHAEIAAAAKTLVRSRFGQRVLQRLYRDASFPMQRRMLINIFDHSGLRAASENYELSLVQIWEKNPAIRADCMRVLHGLVDRFADRGLVDATIVHELMDLTFRFNEHGRNQDLVADLKKALVHICSTKYGSRAAEQCIRIASPKDRAEILGTFTNSCTDMVTGKHACNFLCTILDVVDDTALVQRTILAELAPAVETLLVDAVGCRLLLHLLTPEYEAKVKAFVLPQIADRYCHSKKEKCNTIEVVESCSTKLDKPKMKTITIFEKPWVEKHAAALKYLLPKVQEAVAKDFPRFAQDRFARATLEALVHYATKTDAALKGGVQVDAGFLKKLQAALAEHKVHLPRQKRSKRTFREAQGPEGEAKQPKWKRQKTRHGVLPEPGATATKPPAAATAQRPADAAAKPPARPSPNAAPSIGAASTSAATPSMKKTTKKKKKKVAPQ